MHWYFHWKVARISCFIDVEVAQAMVSDEQKVFGKREIMPLPWCNAYYSWRRKRLTDKHMDVEDDCDDDRVFPDRKLHETHAILK